MPDDKAVEMESAFAIASQKQPTYNLRKFYLTTKDFILHVAATQPDEDDPIRTTIEDLVHGISESATALTAGEYSIANDIFSHIEKENFRDICKYLAKYEAEGEILSGMNHEADSKEVIKSRPTLESLENVDIEVIMPSVKLALFAYEVLKEYLAPLPGHPGRIYEGGG